MSTDVIIILTSLLFSAFFSGIEIAFMSANKLQFELNKDQKGLTNSILNIFYRQQSNFISTLLVGNPIALVIYGIQTASLFKPVLLLITASQQIGRAHV